ILADDEVPEGATMILPDDEDGIVDGIPLRSVPDLAAAHRAAGGAAPAPIPLLPGDLPPPKEEIDLFGVGLQASATPISTTGSGTGKTRPVADDSYDKRRAFLLMAIAGLSAAIVTGAIVALVMKPGPPKKVLPPPPPPATATVLVRADVPVKLTLDGKSKGDSGRRGALLLYPLKTGKHTIGLSADGYHSLSASFEVKAGMALLLGPYSLRPKKKPSTLTVRLAEIFRDAEVRIAGDVVPAVKVGTPVPLPLDTVVELRVGLLGYEDHVKMLQTASGKTIVTEVIMLQEARRGQAAVGSVPPGASVWLDGAKLSCVTPCRIKNLKLTKKFAVKVSLAGYKTSEQTYSFKKFTKTLTIDVRLERGSGGATDTMAAPPATDGALAAAPESGAPPSMRRSSSLPRPRQTEPRAPPERPREARPVEPPSGDAGNCSKNSKGMLVANADPEARVYIDGRNTGRWTPIPPRRALKLRRGKHRVTFVTRRGKRYNYYITVEPCKTTRLIRKLPGG
ncbi:MAG: PEGA domain-containing protein, partial [bacterium]